MLSTFLHFISNYFYLVLPLSFVVAFFGFFTLRRKFPRAAFLFFLFPVFGIVSMIYGGTWNAEYVYKNGVKGEAVITSIVPTNNYVNHVQVVEYHCLLKLSSGKKIKSHFKNNASIFYPINSAFLIPEVGKVFTIKYMEGNESNFIIPTDVSNPQFNCFDLMKKISESQAVLQIDKTDQANKRLLKNNIEVFLKEPCDSNMQKAYKLLLKQLDEKH